MLALAAAVVAVGLAEAEAAADLVTLVELHSGVLMAGL